MDQEPGESWATELKPTLILAAFAAPFGCAPGGRLKSCRKKKLLFRERYKLSISIENDLEEDFVPALRDGAIRAQHCPRVSLRFTLGYSRVLPPGEESPISCQPFHPDLDQRQSPKRDEFGPLVGRRQFRRSGLAGTHPQTTQNKRHGFEIPKRS